MKKILLILCGLFLFAGCGMANTPTKRVEEYLSKYTTHHEDVLLDLDNAIKDENMIDTNSAIYRDVMKRQYKNMKYEVSDEKINGDEATVTVKITVYDLYKVDKASIDYLNNSRDEFLVNDVYDENSYVKYKLNEMLKAEDPVDYTIEFYLNKNDNVWTLEQPDRITREKIHGLYNYEG